MRRDTIKKEIKGKKIVVSDITLYSAEAWSENAVFYLWKLPSTEDLLHYGQRF